MFILYAFQAIDQILIKNSKSFLRTLSGFLAYYILPQKAGTVLNKIVSIIKIQIPSSKK